jgi:hypothetical protein
MRGSVRLGAGVLTVVVTGALLAAEGEPAVPLQGQDLARQSRDRQECHLQASRAAGYDPYPLRAPAAPGAAPRPLAGGLPGPRAGGTAPGSLFGSLSRGPAIGEIARGEYRGAGPGKGPSSIMASPAPATPGVAQEYRRGYVECMTGRGYR